VYGARHTVDVLTDGRIVVEGRARRRVTPDVGVWSATVECHEAVQREAFAACSSRLDGLLAAVRGALGSEPGAEVWASGVRVQPRWDDVARGYRGFDAAGSVGFRAPTATAARLAQAALDAGAVRLEGPSYEVSAAARIRDELLAEAVGAARARAERMASAAGVGVGRARSVTDRAVEGVGGGPGPLQARFALAAEAAPPPSAPEDEELEVVVTVAFELTAPE
jgi:uncharacterized protein YggE